MLAKRWSVEPDEEPEPPPERGFRAWVRRLLGRGPRVEPGVALIIGEYAKYLEERTLPFVRSKPHWCAKGLLSPQLAGLHRALTLEELDVMSYMEKPALVAPRGVSAHLDVLPVELVRALSALRRDDCSRVAADLAADEQWWQADPDDLVTTIRRLRRLARESKKLSANLYLLSEW